MQLEYAYEVRLTVTDYFGAPATYVVKVGAEVVPIAVHPSGKGIGFGGYPTEEAYQVFLAAQFYKTLTLMDVDGNGTNIEIADRLQQINDCVVEQGISGIWTYRKWKSGVAECWGTITPSITSWEVWGNVYEGYPKIDPISFPQSLFFDNNIAWQVTANGYMGMISVESASLVTKDKTPLMWILRPNRSTDTNPVRVSMEAKGKWK